MPGVERVLEKERALGSSIRFEDVLDEVAGVYPLVMRDEQMDAGSCGMVAGLIRDIPTVQGLINRIMRQAEDIICERPDEPVNRGGLRPAGGAVSSQRPASHPGLRCASRPGWHRRQSSTNYATGPVIAGSPEQASR